jgi:hypothetical protein
MAGASCCSSTAALRNPVAPACVADRAAALPAFLGTAPPGVSLSNTTARAQTVMARTNNRPHEILQQHIRDRCDPNEACSRVDCQIRESFAETGPPEERSIVEHGSNLDTVMTNPPFRVISARPSRGFALHVNALGCPARTALRSVVERETRKDSTGEFR